MCYFGFVGLLSDVLDPPQGWGDATARVPLARGPETWRDGPLTGAERAGMPHVIRSVLVGRRAPSVLFACRVDVFV